jgi:hypothetical protein
MSLPGALTTTLDALTATDCVLPTLDGNPPSGPGGVTSLTARSLHTSSLMQRGAETGLRFRQ